MYVCMRTYVCTCVYVCMRVCICVCMYVCVCIYIYAFLHHANSSPLGVSQIVDFVDMHCSHVLRAAHNALGADSGFDFLGNGVSGFRDVLLFM